MYFSSIISKKYLCFVFKNNDFEHIYSLDDVFFSIKHNWHILEPGSIYGCKERNLLHELFYRLSYLICHLYIVHMLYLSGNIGTPAYRYIGPILVKLLSFRLVKTLIMILCFSCRAGKL